MRQSCLPLINKAKKLGIRAISDIVPIGVARNGYVSEASLPNGGGPLFYQPPKLYGSLYVSRYDDDGNSMKEIYTQNYRVCIDHKLGINEAV